MIYTGKKINKILISDIDQNDLYYKISRNFIDEKLIKSIKDFGILEPVVLKKENNTLKVIFGHNRISALKLSGLDSVEAFILDKLDEREYVNHVLFESYLNRIGPAGKIRVFRILDEKFNSEVELKLEIAKKSFNIPSEFISNALTVDGFGRIPDGLKDYIDQKDLNFRLILSLLQLPVEAVACIDKWIKLTGGLRVNIFKSVVEMLTDIYKRDNTLEQVIALDPDGIDEKKRREDYIHSRLSEIRYPQYTDIKARADKYLKEYSSKGIRIDFPAYFEGNTIDIRITAGKNETYDKITNKLNFISEKRLKQLFELL